MDKQNQNIISTDLEEEVNKLEEYRVKGLDKIARVWIFGPFLIVLLLVLVSIYFPFLHGFKALVLFHIVLFGLMITNRLNNNVKRDFRIEFKQKVVSNLIKSRYPTIQYHPAKRISEQDIFASRLFSKTQMNLKGEDMIQGKYKDTDFSLSELKPLKGKNEAGLIFQGLFIKADFHKYFHSETFVLPQTALESFGLNKKKYHGADLIEMEDLDFVSRFRVFTTNDQDARYILSPSMMRRICILQNKFGDDISISFRGDCMYVAIKTSKDYFEHDINNILYADSLICRHVNDLQSILGIIDDLNLNTRIWSKIPNRLLRDNNRADA